MEARSAARRWAETWERCWRRREVEPIVALYADGCRFLSEPFRAVGIGPEAVRAYLAQAFAEEEAVLCRFGEPVVDGDAAAVWWWAALRESGREISLAGTSLLRFDGDGLVIDQRDAWNQADGRREPGGWQG